MKAGLLTGLIVLGGLTQAGSVFGAQPVSIEGSDFQDWSASALQTTLPDGSVLTEYAAASKADQANDSRIVISFIPRFDCSPLISVIIPNASRVSSDWQTVLMQIDDQTMPFVSIVDQFAENGVRLTYNASSEEQRRLLSLLDTSNSAKLVNDSVVQTAGTDTTQMTMSHSLMGSRMSAKAALSACQVHQPVPNKAEDDAG